MLDKYLWPDYSVNIISPRLPLTDRELFFGPLSGEELFLETDLTSIADILVMLELVPSKSWCRKNGWGFDLAPGWNDITFGAKKLRICALTYFEETE